MRAPLLLGVILSLAPSASYAAAGGWVELFAGSSVEHWRAFRGESFPQHGWEVRDGCLTHLAGAGGGDLVTREEYGDFELELEWRVSQGGNSGVLYLVSEDQPETWMSGPEMQVLDDLRHPDGPNPTTSAGALYALIPPGPGKKLVPVGEFNQARLVVKGGHVEHWLNGVKLVEYVLGSPEWQALVRASKFAPYAAYGANRRGRIALQDHGDEVCFRGIRVRGL
jgi:hypothetical protein